MLNEERVILMTKMASYEENEGKKNVSIGNYFRSDYIAVQMLKSIICATIAFAAIFALYIFYGFENFMQEIYRMDILAFAKKILMYYGITILVYGGISYVVYSMRYSKAKRNLKQYYQNLKKLNSLYNK
jgi:hypothetical protein